MPLTQNLLSMTFNGKYYFEGVCRQSRRPNFKEYTRPLGLTRVGPVGDTITCTIYCLPLEFEMLRLII